jgi:hypothetical protein
MSSSSGFIGGGGSHVQQLVAGTGITLSPTSGFGVVTINSSDGANVMLVDGGLCSTYRCGVDNTANGSYSFSGGGQYNLANGNHSFIGGGLCNCATACSAIIGGFGNNASAPFSGAFGCNLNACNACTFYSNNLCACGNTSSITSNVTCLTSGQAVCSSSNGLLTNFNIPSTSAYGLYAQTSDSATITATTVESSLIGAGVGTLSVPANGFSIGDSFIATVNGIMSSVNNATIDIKIKSNGVILTDTGAISLVQTNNKNWKLEIQFTIRSIGTATNASIASSGLFSYVGDSAAVYQGTTFSTINNTTFNTTINNTLVLTAQWNTNNAGNSISSRNFTLTKVY